ncbi:hypothetical protein [Xanthomonas virus PB119]|nr:hypothetical protein [Xanthomonas virus PB119]
MKPLHLLIVVLILTFVVTFADLIIKTATLLLMLTGSLIVIAVICLLVYLVYKVATHGS